MRILIACEFSGRVRDAFRTRGHDAISADLLPSDAGDPHHQGDVLEILNDGWDLMIGFPPCTYLCVSGLHWNVRRPERNELTDQAAAFFLALWNAPIPKVALENPVGVMSSRFRKPDQIIQPWQYGHPESKATCLWLRGLPPLMATTILTERRANLTANGQNRLGPSPDRWKLRSLTYPGIAEAMARQWSGGNEPQEGSR